MSRESTNDEWNTNDKLLLTVKRELYGVKRFESIHDSRFTIHETEWYNVIINEITKRENWKKMSDLIESRLTIHDSRILGKATKS